jgi:hypothetical protein
MLYRQMAGSLAGQRGHGIGTLLHGAESVDVKADWYENLTRFGQRDLVRSTWGPLPEPLPLRK